MKNRLTLIIVALVCIYWAIPIPGLDPCPYLLDDLAAGAGAAVSILKLIRQSPHMT